MGLHDDITKDIQDAFDGDLADAVKIADLVVYSTAYSTATGTVVNTEASTSTRGVITPVVEDMIDGEAVLRGDVSILILQDELATAPKIDDLISEGSDRYRIYSISADPAAVQWTLLGRRT